METNKAIKAWAATAGIGIGALPFFPMALNPPTPWLIFLGPILMAGLAFAAATVCLSFPSPIPLWKKIVAGITLAATYVLLAALLLGILFGGEWWAWASVIVAFGLTAAVPIGALLGWMGASYIEGVRSGHRLPSTDFQRISFVALVCSAIFIGIPGVAWVMQH